MNSGFTIREATIEDAPALVRIFRDSIGALAADPANPYDLEQLAAWQGAMSNERMAAKILDERFLVAEVEGVPAGFGALWPAESELDYLYVSPRHARRGLGRALVMELERLALVLSKGAQIRLTVTGSHNAQGFYEYLGYSVVEQIVKSVGGVSTGCVRMTKTISRPAELESRE